MSIRRISTQRLGGSSSVYIGHKGEIFYNPNDTGPLRISDGVTPGGIDLVNGSIGPGTVIDADLNGNVTGSLTGNVVGNLLGNVTGNLTGNIVRGNAVWSFDPSGELHLPENGTITSSTGIGIESAVDGYTSGLYFTGNRTESGHTFVYATHDVYVRSDNNGTPKDWIFDRNGTVTVPDGGAYIQTNDNNTLDIISPGLDGLLSLTAAGHQSVYLDANSVTIQADKQYDWVFDTDGNLTIPSNSTIKSVSGDINIEAPGNVYIKSKGHVFNFDSDTVGRLIMPPSGVIAGDDVGNGLNLFVGNTTTEEGYHWRFNTEGNVVLPVDKFVTYPDGTIYGGGAGSVNIEIDGGFPSSIFDETSLVIDGGVV